MSRDSRVQIRHFCSRRPFISLSRVQIMGFCPRRWIHVCRSSLFAPVIPLFHCHGCRSWVLPPSALMNVVLELRQEPAQLRVLRKRNSSGKASSDAGPELAGRESCVAMESPQALMCPLEKGVRGIEISGLCRCPAMNWSARS